MNAYDSEAIVVGGGIIGLSVAYELARSNVEVQLIDPSFPGATGVAAGMLAPVTEATFGEEDLLRLNLDAAAAFPGFIEGLRDSSGTDLTLDSDGTIYMARDRDQAEALRRLFDFQSELGLDVRWLDVDAVRDLEPAVHPSVVSGVMAPSDRSIDPRAMRDALSRALANMNVPRIAAEVVALAADNGSVVIRTPSTSLRCRHAVLAAGPWSGGIEGAPNEVSNNTRPVKGQIVRLEPRPGATDLPRHVLRSEEVYLVARPSGELVVGATMEEQGFDLSVTAGGVFELLRAADEIFPAIREMELVETSAGLRPGSRDNAPLIGPTSVPGVIACTGHFRNGVLLAPLSAACVAQLIRDGSVPDALKPFDPMRFA